MRRMLSRAAETRALGSRLPASDIKASIANIRSVSEKIARGEGSLGKLLGDDSMVRDVQSLMKKADRALDGLDDTGPISAVGVIAGGLF